MYYLKNYNGISQFTSTNFAPYSPYSSSSSSPSIFSYSPSNAPVYNQKYHLSSKSSQRNRLVGRRRRSLLGRKPKLQPWLQFVRRQTPCFIFNFNNYYLYAQFEFFKAIIFCDLVSQLNFDMNERFLYFPLRFFAILLTICKPFLCLAKSFVFS